MTDLIPLAYHYGGGWTDWLGHVAISAVIHALIYSLIFRLVHDLTLAQASGAGRRGAGGAVHVGQVARSAGVVMG